MLVRMSAKKTNNVRMRLDMCMERVMGIEPTLQAWEACVLPLNYTRNEQINCSAD